MEPLVSILIPAYNAEQWIAETIRSALGQSWRHKEIIVVDDGSTDGTLSVARQFEPDGVRVVTQSNQGAAVARNEAFSFSRGDYIQWLDADDLLSSDKIAHQMHAAEQAKDKRTLLSCAWAYFRYRPSKAKFVPTPLWCDLDPIEWMTRKWEGNLHMQPATWLVSRELTEAAGPWDKRMAVDDDGEYFCRVVTASSGIRFISQSKVYYRITPGSRLSYIGRSDKKIEAQLLSMKLQIGYVRAREESERVRAASVKYLQTWLGYFYPSRPDLMHEAQQLAADLGGWLSLPKASWKYAWIEKLFGFAAAQRTGSHYNRVKSSALGMWDKMMYSFERSRTQPS
jgi:glycosyltransferase involved in cell wall biosynthesis